MIFVYESNNYREQKTEGGLDNNAVRKSTAQDWGVRYRPQKWPLELWQFSSSVAHLVCCLDFYSYGKSQSISVLFLSLPPFPFLLPLRRSSFGVTLREGGLMASTFFSPDFGLTAGRQLDHHPCIFEFNSTVYPSGEIHSPNPGGTLKTPLKTLAVLLTLVPCPVS